MKGVTSSALVGLNAFLSSSNLSEDSLSGLFLNFYCKLITGFRYNTLYIHIINLHVHHSSNWDLLSKKTYYLRCSSESFRKTFLMSIPRAVVDSKH